MDTSILAIARYVADSGYTSGSDTVFNIFAPFVIGFIVFAAFYSAIYFYYRNTDKKYEFERKTDIQVANVQAFDSPGRERTGVSSPLMEDRNSGEPRARVRRVQLEE